MARRFAAAVIGLRQFSRSKAVVVGGAQPVSIGLVGRTAIKAERLRSGEGAAFEMLAGWGCDEAQGYFISRPLAAEDYADWLAANRTAPLFRS